MYPTRPVRVIVAQSAEANMDTIARIVKGLFPQTAGIYAEPEK